MPTTCKIWLTNDTKVYNCGEKVEGTVELTVTETKRMNGKHGRSPKSIFTIHALHVAYSILQGCCSETRFKKIQEDVIVTRDSAYYLFLYLATEKNMAFSIRGKMGAPGRR